MAKKNIPDLKQTGDYHQIQRIQIRVATKFNLKQTILFFLDEIWPKRVGKFPDVKLCDNWFRKYLFFFTWIFRARKKLGWYLYISIEIIKKLFADYVFA